MKVTLWVVLGVSLAAGLTAQQAPNGARPPATALIVGQLVDGSSGSPVSSAMITLAPPPGAPAPNRPAIAFTDGNGRFVFHSLRAGAYALSAERPGYITSQSGQGRRIELADGQRLTNVTMKIWKYASISGRLFDEAGEPVVGAMLCVLRSTGPATARRYAEFSGMRRTDDRGIYRFSELLPGDYVVMLPSIVMSVPLAVVDAYMDADVAPGFRDNPIRRDLQASGADPINSGTRIGDQLIQVMATQLTVSETGKTSIYPITFYPGVRDVSAATVVSVKSGEERTGVDFSARPVPAARVSGRVIGPDGPAANLAVKLVPVGMEAISDEGLRSFAAVAQTITRGDGSFVAPIVPAGDYIASVLKIPVPARPAPTDRSTMTVATAGGGTASFSSGSSSGSAPADPVLWGRTPVSVGDAAVDGVTVRLANGATVSGRVEFETGIAPAPTAADLQRTRISLSPVEGLVIGGPTDATIAADGSFKSRGYPPGRYYVTVASPTAAWRAAWTLKSLMVAGRNMRDAPLDLGESDVAGVVATFTDKAGEISGTVVSGASDGDVRVLLLPADYQSWIQGGMHPRAMRSAAWRDGVYRLTGVLAGEYLVVAISVAAGSPDLQNPQTMAALARQGTRVTIGEREKRTLSLTVVTVRQP